MAKHHILSKSERKAFHSPPLYTLEGRQCYFHVSEDIKVILHRMRSATNQVGFMLQLGYFKCAGRFFTADQFYKRDIEFVAKLLNLERNQIHIEKYHHRKFRDHQKQILTLQGFSSFNQEAKVLLTTEVERLVSKQIRPKTMVVRLCELFKHKKIEAPSYNQFATIIAAAEMRFESQLLSILENTLTVKQQTLLNTLLPDNNDEPQGFYQRSPLTILKNMIYSTRPEKIKENVRRFLMIKALFDDVKNTLNALALSSEAIQYYAVWVQKSRTLQTLQPVNLFKRYLYLIAFISHYYHLQQDILIHTLLKSVQAVVSKVRQQQKDILFDNRKAKDRATQHLAESYGQSRSVLKQIKEIIISSCLSDTHKVEAVRELLHKKSSETFTPEEEDALIKFLDKEIMNTLKNNDYYDLLEAQSIILQNRVSLMLKHLLFNPVTSDKNLLKAIHFAASSDPKTTE